MEIRISSGILCYCDITGHCCSRGRAGWGWLEEVCWRSFDSSCRGHVDRPGRCKPRLWKSAGGIPVTTNNTGFYLTPQKLTKILRWCVLPCRRCVGTLWWWAGKQPLDSRCKEKLPPPYSRSAAKHTIKHLENVILNQMLRRWFVHTGPSFRDSIASSHNFLLSSSSLINAFCSLLSLYASTFIFLGVPLDGELFSSATVARNTLHTNWWRKALQCCDVPPTGLRFPLPLALSGSFLNVILIFILFLLLFGSDGL